MSVAQIVTAPRVRPIVEIGVGSTNEPAGAGQWQTNPATAPNVSRWQDPTVPTTNPDGSTWVGRDPYWWDITCDVIDVTTFVGRERADMAWEVGTATVVVANATGWADFPPTDPAQTFLAVRPGEPIRVGVSIDDAAPIYLWGGYIDSQAPGFDAEEGEVVTLECIDAKGEVGRAMIPALVTAVGANQPADVRVNAILEQTDWPSWRRDLQSSSVQLNATTYGAQAVDLLNLAADSSGGAVFGDPAGRVVYRPRDWNVVTPITPIDGVIGNFGLVGASLALTEDPPGSGLYDLDVTEDPPATGLYELDVPDGYALTEDPPGSGLFYVAAIIPVSACPVSWETTFSREDISTKVVLARGTDASATPPIAPIVREDVEARAMFGSETFERTDLETRLTFDMELIAERLLEVRSWRNMPRIAAVTLDAGTGTQVVDVLAAADPYKPARFYVRHRADSGRTVFNRTMTVVGVEHAISPETWTARLALDDAAPFQVSSSARWSDGTAESAYWNDTTTPNALRLDMVPGGIGELAWH